MLSDKNVFLTKIYMLIFFLSLHQSLFCGYSLVRVLLLRTHNKCFGGEIRKISKYSSCRAMLWVEIEGLMMLWMCRLLAVLGCSFINTLPLISHNKINYVPSPKGKGTYCFWCGSHWHWYWHDTFLSAQYLVNQRLDSHQFSRTYNWDIAKNLLDFGYLDLIFKITAAEKLKILLGTSSNFSENTVTSLI